MKVRGNRTSLKTELFLLCIMSFCSAFSFYVLISRFSVGMVHMYYNAKSKLDFSKFSSIDTWVIEKNAKTCVLLLSVMLFFFLLIGKVKKKIEYLIELNNELSKLSESLENPISIRGNDEITQMAENVDQLRLSIIEKLANERRAYNANMHLVTSLFHDIKTPLTAVIGYIELARQKVKGDEELIKYLDGSLEKSIRLKSLTNELFGHFFIHSNNYEVFYEIVNGNELIIQMLEEHLFDLEDKGICVRRNVSEIICLLGVNISLLHRLFDNLYSTYIQI